MLIPVRVVLSRAVVAVDAQFPVSKLAAVHARVTPMLPVVTSESPSPYEKAIRVPPLWLSFFFEYRWRLRVTEALSAPLSTIQDGEVIPSR